MLTGLVLLDGDELVKIACFSFVIGMLCFVLVLVWKVWWKSFGILGKTENNLSRWHCFSEWGGEQFHKVALPSSLSSPTSIAADHWLGNSWNFDTREGHLLWSTTFQVSNCCRKCMLTPGSVRMEQGSLMMMHQDNGLCFALDTITQESDRPFRLDRSSWKSVSWFTGNGVSGITGLNGPLPSATPANFTQEGGARSLISFLQGIPPNVFILLCNREAISSLITLFVKPNLFTYQAVNLFSCQTVNKSLI